MMECKKDIQGAMVKAFGPCSSKGNSSRLVGSKTVGSKRGWGQEMVGRKPWMGKSHWGGIAGGEGHRQWRVTRKGIFRWSEERLQWETGSARPIKLLCYEDYNMASCNCRVLRIFCISCHI